MATATEPRASKPVAKGKKIGKPQLLTKPVPVGDGYSMTLSTYSGVITVKIAKGNEEIGQSYWWVFGKMDSAIKANKKLSVVSLDAAFTTTDDVGASGSIAMTSEKQKPKGPAVMDGCSGVKWEHRDGTLNGSFVFDTGTDLFGVIETDSLELEYARRSVGKSRCTELDVPVCMKNYSMALYFGGQNMLWTAELDDGQHLLNVDVRKYFSNGYYMQILRETVPGSSLQAAADLSSGSLQGGGAISGSVSYSTDQPPQTADQGFGCGNYTKTDGVVTGDIVFNFDTGVVDPFAESDSISGRLLEGS